jgi:hypothetical protein
MVLAMPEADARERAEVRDENAISLSGDSMFSDTPGLRGLIG